MPLTYDVVIAGAGPAGSVAATVLARAGARVALIDRARFPRHKLCGDTLNPGVLGILRRLKLGAVVDACGLPIAGMIVTGADGTVIEGSYPSGLVARSIKRADFGINAGKNEDKVSNDIELNLSVAGSAPQ